MSTLTIGGLVPPISLRATNGDLVDLSILAGLSVVYAYPRTSPPDAPPIEGWDMIPGARGCTPQSCGFRDHHAELVAAGAMHVFGLSTQTSAYQAEVKARLHLPFDILSDPDAVFAKAIGIGTFEAAGMALLRRTTLLLNGGVVERVYDEIEDPAGNAEAVLKDLQNYG